MGLVVDGTGAAVVVGAAAAVVAVAVEQTPVDRVPSWWRIAAAGNADWRRAIR